MPKIDIHTHILPRDIPRWSEKFGYGGFVGLDHYAPCRAIMVRDDGVSFREVGENCWSPEQRILECDDAGVDVQVLSTVPVMFNYWTKPEDGAEAARFFNDHIAEVVTDFPLRFIGLGCVPLQDTTLAIRELERCRGIGMGGVQIGTNVNQLNLGDPRFFEFFAACSELGMAVFVHPWEMAGEADMKEYWLPWLVGMPAEASRAICSLIFSGVLERLPDLRICFAHGGGAFPATVGRVQHGFDVRPDLCAKDNDRSPREYLDRIYYDSLVHDPNYFRYLIDTVGADRIALGSDYPFPLGEARPGTLIESMDFDDATRNRLLSGTAMEWLGIAD